MAKVTQTSSYASQYFPSRMQFIMKDLSPPPKLTRKQERALLALGWFGLRLDRARRRQSQAKKKAEWLRDLILDRLPESIYGLRVFGHRRIEILASTPHYQQPANPEEFLKYLGDHRDEVFTGFRLPARLTDPETYQVFVTTLIQLFGDEVAKELTLDFNLTKMWELVNDGSLPQPPEELFKSVPADSRRVLIKILPDA